MLTRLARFRAWRSPALGALRTGPARGWVHGARHASSGASTPLPPAAPEMAVGAPFPALPPEGLTPAMEAAIAAANGSYAAEVAPDSWSLTHRAMELIDSLHVASGFEWWQTIFALTVAIRVAAFPFTLFSMRNSAALTRVKPQSDALMEQASKCDMSTADGQRRHAKIRADLFKLYSDNNCSPFYALGPIMLQLPVFVFMFSALQAMSSHKTGHPWHGFETGGLSWFTDLSVPDPYFALPIAASGTFLLTTLLQDPTMVASQEQARTMQYAGIGMSVVFLPIMATTSSATVLYFAATNVIGVAQTALLRSKAFRRLARLPTTAPALAGVGGVGEPPPAPPAPPKIEYFVPRQVKGRKGGTGKEQGGGARPATPTRADGAAVAPSAVGAQSAAGPPRRT
ncbi:hypothetical protein KFE25_002133 [Diacronema lutheri]|uniref:Membrane insertase YidC/Oxa/ALB C-terminal domain-containing protein n=2 Tax=Diacronema lutheri TaxID=2081491 RepID=A0A8J5XLL2_DIALT|nr:hypothetical protein KFE25_002133 [Diacronema lutheri]